MKLTNDMLAQFGFTLIPGDADWKNWRSKPSMRGGPVCHITVDEMMGCDGWEIGDRDERGMIPPPDTVEELTALMVGLGIPR